MKICDGFVNESTITELGDLIETAFPSTLVWNFGLSQENTQHIEMNVEGETRPGVRLLKSWINKSIKVVS